MSLKIIIPMAGHGSRFGASNLLAPKYLLEVLPGQYMIDIVLQYLKPNEPHQFIFVCREEHVRDFDLHRFFKRRVKNFKIITTKRVTKGPACTALLAHPDVNDRQPLLIAYCDDHLDIRLSDHLKNWRKKNADGGLLVLPSTGRAKSYAACKKDGSVTATAEKKVISRWATAGMYYFREGRFFVRAVRQAVRKKLTSKGEFFVSTTYNHLIANDLKVIAHKIPVKAFHTMGTPQALKRFIRNRVPSH